MQGTKRSYEQVSHEVKEAGGMISLRLQDYKLTRGKQDLRKLVQLHKLL